MVAIADCPECGKALQVPPEDVGRRVACPRCAHQFVARAIDEAPRRDEPRAERPRDQIGEDDRPRRARRSEDDDEDDRPRRKRDRPAGRECEECGADLDDDGTCPECDARPASRPTARQLREAHSKKTAAGICGILLGGFGVHKFVLGFTTPGVIMLLVSLLTLCIAFKVMWIIGIVEGIIYLTKTDEEFYQTYMVEQKEWF
jgi:TM2 domain-containing membrane protein YozV/DNA-directed RNA polymerase subunit RPC12/RpoP